MTRAPGWAEKSGRHLFNERLCHICFVFYLASSAIRYCVSGGGARSESFVLVAGSGTSPYIFFGSLHCYSVRTPATPPFFSLLLHRAKVWLIISFYICSFLFTPPKKVTMVFCLL